MKILKVTADNFKLCENNFTISFIPQANKTGEDKEYELQEIDKNLFVYNTVSLIGKNASGKTTVVQLLSLIYDIFSFFRVKDTFGSFFSPKKDIKLDIVFYHEGNLYRYITDLYLDNDVVNKTIKFKNEYLYKKPYFKTAYNKIFDFKNEDEMKIEKHLPEDTSILYEVLQKINLKGIYLRSDDIDNRFYSDIFSLYNAIDKKHKIIGIILKMLDENLENIEMVHETKFIVTYKDKKKIEVNNRELYDILSSGTSKGLGLFILVFYSLRCGVDLVIDEIENHFHKTLVENIVNLYKDKSVNKKNATLIFTTHYCELLDLFNRTDNIYITKCEKNIYIENMYKDYHFRPELSKSKKFYSNAFGTDVNYERLMDFKKELKQ